METVIDWSKWPEDAELFLPNQQGTSECVVKFCENGAVFFAYSKNFGWTRWSGENRETLLERFKYVSKAVTEEDIPPIGAHVVVHDDGSLVYGHGESGEVLAYVDGCAVIRMSYGLGCFLPRCLRTQEQIEAEKRIASAYAMCAIARSLSNTDAVALYDAGYRLEVTP